MGRCRALVAEGENSGELEIGQSAIIEVDAGRPGIAVPGYRSIAERVNLEMLVVRWFGIVGEVRRPRQGARSRHRKADESRTKKVVSHAMALPFDREIYARTRGDSARPVLHR